MNIKLEGYEIDREIARGQRSVVFAAHRDQSAVAIKLTTEEYPPPALVARFEEEYRILKSLNLPGVVRALQLEMVGHRPTIVQELAPGITLRALLEKEGHVDPRRFLTIALGLVEAVQGLHAAGIIHRDLKPSNVMYDPDSKRVCIVDFGSATTLAREKASQELRDHGVEGTYAYISPEQTGRLNRTVDYRTDFYSLGVTFYELLTGSLPFEARDPLGLVHAHIALAPRPVLERRPSVPAALSAIVGKLLEKAPEQRYQTAAGLRKDLEFCLENLTQPSALKDFVPGQQDRTDRFRLSQQLFGRERELGLIDVNLREVCQGAARLVLLAGEPGVGKSRLLVEGERLVAARDARFVAGKFDEFKQNQPYSALIQATQDLIRQLLGESDAELRRWSERLRAKVGPDLDLLYQALPGLRLVMGNEEPRSNPTGETRSGFRMAFQRFLKTCATAERPLALFLDDLQWIDGSSLELLEALYTDPELKYMLLLIAIRGSQPTGVLKNALEGIRSRGYEYRKITLGSLDLQATNKLIASSLSEDDERTVELSEVVQRKTGGNVFLVREYLTALHERKLILYRPGEGWTWDMEQVRTSLVTPNVVSLMVERISSLPAQTRRIVTQASCLGMKFYADTLSGATGQSEEETRDDLLPAIEEGLIIFSPTQISFAHDRLREAAYGILEPLERKRIHRRAGEFLLANTSRPRLEERIFVIVEHLNQAVDLITEPDARRQLAQFNLMAGERALRATAYDAASRYLARGLELIDRPDSEHERDLHRELLFRSAESEYLVGNPERAEALFERALAQAKDREQRLRIHETLIPLLAGQNRQGDALDHARRALALLGVTLPTRPPRLWFGAWRIRAAARRLERLIAGADPEGVDADATTILRLLENCLVPAYTTRAGFLPWIVHSMLKRSLARGRTQSTSVALAAAGMILTHYRENLSEATRLVDLAVRLEEARAGGGTLARTLFIRGAFLQHRCDRLSEGMRDLDRAITVAMEAGDFHFATHAVGMFAYLRFLRSRNLEETRREFEKYSTLLSRLHTGDGALFFGVWWQTIASMRQADNDSQLRGQHFNADRTLPLWKKAGNHSQLFSYHLARVRLHHLLGEYQRGLEQAVLAHQHASGAFSSIMTVDLLYYEALCAARLAFFAPEHAPAFSVARSRLVRLTGESSLHEHRRLHLEAEASALQGDDSRAMELFDRAAARASQEEFHFDQAVINEHSALFHGQRARTRVSRVYLAEAEYLFSMLGCDSWLHRARRESPGLVRASSGGLRTTRSSTSTGATDSILDFSSVLKAQQALSGEIVLSKLLSRLIHILIENAGAQRGAFLMEDHGTLFLEAESEYRANEVALRESIPLEQTRNLPRSLINYVARTAQPLVLDQATADETFGADPFIQGHNIKSVLCVPLLHQGKLAGIAYLENNLSAGAFTPERLEVVQALASQAAISVENARLYMDLESKVAERTNDLNTALTEVRALKEQQDGDYFLTSLLVEPLRTVALQGNRVTAQSLIHQKKRFRYKTWDAEIGGDLNLAHSMEIAGKDCAVFLNADAMGKSIQGAAGTLVVGAVFESIVAYDRALQIADPAAWLKEAFSELCRVFATFSGYMMATLGLGIIENDTGRLHYLVAEHPALVLLRNGQASFMECRRSHIKLGMLGARQQDIEIESVQLLPGDVVILGTDGRDDILVGHDSRGNQIVNEDETAFLRAVEGARGELGAIYEGLKKTGELMDDIALLRLEYRAVD